LHFLEFQVLQPDGGTEVVPNQLVNPNFRQTFTVFWLQVFVKLVLQPFFYHAVSNETRHNFSELFMNGRSHFL
jgi:hypothetical protein